MFFATIDNLNDLKAEYRRLALMYHPDRGGDLDTMKAINIEYESRFEQLKRLHNAKASADTSGKTRATTETAAEFIDIINALLKLDGLTVELCGCWLWIGGNTKPHKDKLAAIGCHWAPNNKLWSWHHAEDTDRRYRGKKDMAAIRLKYGSVTFTANDAELAVV